METKVHDLFAELDRGPAAAEVIVSSSQNTTAGTPSSVASSPVQVVSKKPKMSVEQQRELTLKNIEMDLFQRAMAVTNDSLRAFEIDPGADRPPQEWVDELEYLAPGHGAELAEQRFRTARSGLLNKKDAPVAIQVAQAIAVGISRSRAQLNAGPKTLNVQVVQMSAPMPDFPELLLTPGEK